MILMLKHSRVELKFGCDPEAGLLAITGLGTLKIILEYFWSKWFLSEIPYINIELQLYMLCVNIVCCGMK